MLKSGKTGWRSPSNIALVKYWGKKQFQIPLNPSLSMTLSDSYTETVIEYSQKSTSGGPGFSFLFQGEKNSRFDKKIERFLYNAANEIPVLGSLFLNIGSKNTFPHSSGVASSASFFSSLALCLCHIDLQLSGIKMDEARFFNKASNLARLGSGSACRSVYGGWVLWGETKEIKGSSDEYAIPVTNMVHKNFQIYYDSILIVSSEEKQIGSSPGHKMMRSNPFKDIKIMTGKVNVSELLNTLKSGNQKSFREIVESESANLHAMFLTSKPFFVLIKPGTLEMINKLTKFRNETGLDFCYSLDAGPNIHLLYSEESRVKMLDFINSELAPLCENGKWFDDRTGNGPELIYS